MYGLNNCFGCEFFPLFEALYEIHLWKSHFVEAPVVCTELGHAVFAGPCAAIAFPLARLGAAKPDFHLLCSDEPLPLAQEVVPILLKVARPVSRIELE